VLAETKLFDFNLTSTAHFKAEHVPLAADR